jgi:hypothetical protein
MDKCRGWEVVLSVLREELHLIVLTQMVKGVRIMVVGWKVLGDLCMAGDEIRRVWFCLAFSLICWDEVALDVQCYDHYDLDFLNTTFCSTLFFTLVHQGCNAQAARWT